MLGSLGMALVTLRLGLRLRSARRLGMGRSRESLRLHVTLARVTLGLLWVGFAGGPISMWALRGQQPFATAHAWIALVALGLFTAAGILGHRLERGRSRARGIHALLALLAVLVGAAALGTGLVLLP
jgi:hypothetical protein